MAQRASQFRLIQRRLLTKFKNKTPTPIASLDTLLKDTYEKISTSLNLLEKSEAELALSRIELSCAVRLVHLLVGLNDTVPHQRATELAAALHPVINCSEEQVRHKKPRKLRLITPPPFLCARLKAHLLSSHICPSIVVYCIYKTQ